MTQIHRHFEFAICAHSAELADFIRKRLNELREAVEEQDDCHTLRLVEAHFGEGDVEEDEGEATKATSPTPIRNLA